MQDMLPKEIQKNLPALYSQENAEDPNVVLHYFNPVGGGDWYIIEGGRVNGGEWLFFGLCDLGFPELGYVSLTEMVAVELPFGARIERDEHWTVRPLSKVREMTATMGEVMGLGG